MFDFMTKMSAQMTSYRASLVPLFMVADKAVKTKLQVDDTLEKYGAIVIDIS